jgi:hypothetical protein
MNSSTIPDRLLRPDDRRKDRISAETGHRSQQHEEKPEGDEEVAQHISPRKSA